MKKTKILYDKYITILGKTYHSAIDVELALEDKTALENELYNHVLCLKPTELFDFLAMIRENAPRSASNSPRNDFNKELGSWGLF